MQFERTNGRCEDLDGELSLRCRISLHLAPSWLGSFIRLGRGASAPPTEGMSVGTKQGEPQKKSPQIISLVVSRYQKNIQIGEKNISRVPGGGGWRKAWRAGGLDGGPRRLQNKFPTAGKGQAGQEAAAPGRPSRIARDWRRTEAGVPGEKFRFVVVAAALPRISTAPKSSPPTGVAKRCARLHGRAQQLPGDDRAPRVAQARASGSAGEGRRGGEGRGGPGSSPARPRRTRGGAGLAPEPRPRLSPPLALAWRSQFHRGSAVSFPVDGSGGSEPPLNPSRRKKKKPPPPPLPPLPLLPLLPPPPPPPRSPQLWAPGGARASRGRGRGAAGSRRT